MGATSRTFRIPSAEFARRVLTDQARAVQRDLPGVIALAGGLPIKAADEVTCSIGVSCALPSGEHGKAYARRHRENRRAIEIAEPFVRSVALGPRSRVPRRTRRLRCAVNMGLFLL
jgi:hypothetical protein